MKKIAIVLVILFSFNLIPYTTACAAPVYSYTEDIPVSDSIMLTKVEEFHSGYNLSYSYIKADLTNENTSLKLLTSKEGTDVLDTVENLSKTDEATVAAMNADFFSSVGGGRGFSLGIQIEDGKLTQSPINPSTMATVSYIDDAVSMSYLDFHIMAVAPNWEYNEIRHLNKHTTYYGDILMYTSDFNGGFSPAPGGEVLEVVVSDGKIVEFRRNMPPVEIPEDGCVLVVSEGVNMFFANNFNVGDEIRFDYYLTPDILDAEAAFGGGAMLVSEGKKVGEYSHVVSGYQPRSAIGIDKDGTTVYLVAVNGRQDKSRGMTMSELSDLMLSLGCYNAVNLDGGGSTNMQASTVWYEKMHTVNSPTENRKVINAVGLTYKNSSEETENEPYGIMLENEKNAVFIGDGVKITSAVYDENFRPVSAKIKWSSDYGEVENGVFVPEVSGYVTVEARCHRANAKTEIYVVDTVSGIDAESHIRLKEGETKELNISVFDDLGHYVDVSNTELFEITSSDEEVVSVSGKTITAHKNGNAVITIEKDGAISYTSVVVGYADSYKEMRFLPAAANVYTVDEASATDEKFVVGALQTGTKTLLSNLVNENTTEYVLTHKNNAILGNNSAFSAREDENALYITLDASKGGIRNTDKTQWDKLVNAINNTQKENVFLLSDSSVFSESDFENKVIKDYLSSLDKNVFVITGGKRNTFKNINGVKYFTLGNNEEELLTLTHLNNYTTLEFYFGKDITFEWKSIY